MQIYEKYLHVVLFWPTFLLECVFAASYELPFSVHLHDFCIADLGNINGDLLTGGIHLDDACGCHRGGFHPLDVAHQLRGNHQMAHAVGAFLLTDASNGLEQPFVGLAHHEVILRRTVFGHPLFGERRGASLQLIAVARGFVVIEHLEEQFVLTVFCQYLEQVAVAYIAGGQTRAVTSDILDEMA